MKGHFTPERHFGFEGAAWYWHFVDVVWLGLYIAGLLALSHPRRHNKKAPQGAFFMGLVERARPTCRPAMPLGWM